MYMYGTFQQFLQNEIATIKDNGLYKSERIIVSEQGLQMFMNLIGMYNRQAQHHLS